MLRPRVSLHSFLSSAKSTLNQATAQNASPVTFVIGNEAADLDSVCSAIILAYLRTYTTKSKEFYIPLSNIPRADLNLRPELLPVLSHANLRPTDLLTLSDLPDLTSPSSRLPPEHTKWVLVDHNAMTGSLGAIYGQRLAGCIDHHDEEHKVPRNTGNEPRIVKKCGSCSSLVVQYCREAWDSLAAQSTQTEEKKWNAELARLALAPVLIDTSNLKNESKTTEIDVDIAGYLEKWINAEEGGQFEAEEYFEEISEAEKDVDGLSLVDLLRKDYKEWNDGDGGVPLGICSVVKDMSFLVEKAGSPDQLHKAVRDFAAEQNLSVCSVMTRTLNKDKFTRELLVWGLDQNGVESARRFEEDAKEKLGLEEWDNGSLNLEDGDQWCRCWSQGNAQDGRKQIAPLLRSSISSKI